MSTELGGAWWNDSEPTAQAFVWIRPCRDGTGATDDEAYVRLTLNGVVRHLRLAGMRGGMWRRIGQAIVDAVPEELV